MKAQRASQVFGPFWGELGWEVAQWAPWVNARADAEQHDRILCQPGHADLYAYAGPISQSHPRPNGATPDMMDPWCGGSTMSRAKPGIKVVKGVPCIDGDLKPVPLYPGCAAPRRFIVLHCRSIPKCPERNLYPGQWDFVVEELNKHDFSPVIIGSDSDYVPCGDVLDRRGCSLDDTISYLRTAAMVIGASSGPMHLAQACEAPVIVWSGNAKKDEPRYKEVWNHFGSPVHFIDSSWQPSYKVILDGLRYAL